MRVVGANQTDRKAVGRLAGRPVWAAVNQGADLGGPASGAEESPAGGGPESRARPARRGAPQLVHESAIRSPFGAAAAAKEEARNQVQPSRTCPAPPPLARANWSSFARPEVGGRQLGLIRRPIFLSPHD